MRGALRRWHESCLVNAIVLQTWEAAHGRRRDLVVGVTGPNGFSAHAWLQGDPVPVADDAPIDVSLLNAIGGEKSAGQEEANWSGDGSTSLTSFTELLRRAAPEYVRD